MVAGPIHSLECRAQFKVPAILEIPELTVANETAEDLLKAIQDHEEKDCQRFDTGGNDCGQPMRREAQKIAG
jgi:hypothetical protein